MEAQSYGPNSLVGIKVVEHVPAGATSTIGQPAAATPVPQPTPQTAGKVQITATPTSQRIVQRVVTTTSMPPPTAAPLSAARTPLRTGQASNPRQLVQSKVIMQGNVTPRPVAPQTLPAAVGAPTISVSSGVPVHQPITVQTTPAVRAANPGAASPRIQTKSPAASPVGEMGPPKQFELGNEGNTCRW